MTIEDVPLPGFGPPFSKGDRVRWSPAALAADPMLHPTRVWTVTECGDDPLDGSRWILRAVLKDKGSITTRWSKSEDPRVLRST